MESCAPVGNRRLPLRHYTRFVSPLWRHIRPQDLVWLLAFSVLAIASPERDPVVLTMLVALGVVQVIEPRIGVPPSVILKLICCFFILAYGGGISSSLFVVVFLPAITAATNLNATGAVLGTAASCAVYLMFIFFIQSDLYLDYQAILEVATRVLMVPVMAFLTYQLASQQRAEARKLQETAERLQEAQAEARRSERLAALGQLTAGLAHELRNPLGTMKSSAELLKRNVPADNAIATEMAGFISSEVDRTNSLITRFLEFAKPHHIKLENGDLAALLDRVIERFERERSPTMPEVSVYKNYSPDVGPVAFEEQLLERVFYNLITNAAQASPNGAAVTVKTKPVETEEGAGVEVSVIDRGSGIEPKNLENVFNPFFTTKPEGVGLGLAIVSKIVDEHGGKITVESTPGEGSVFRVYLPMG